MPSASIARFDYDEGTETLSVWFVANGRRYNYQGVPLETYEDFRRAFSKGRFFNAHIRDRYPYRWIRSPKSNP